MLNAEIKRQINSARNILVGRVPDPKAQVEQITTALIYKFMDDMDRENIEVGLQPQFFVKEYKDFAWSKLMDSKMSGQNRLDLYVQAIAKMPQNPYIPQLFRDIFKGAFLPFRDSRTLNLFLKEINNFQYDHSENLGNAFEYLLSILGSQGDAGQFRTPRHIIDFIVSIIDPKKNETILDPACGTAGFLISSFKHILKNNSSETTKGNGIIEQGETATETIIADKKVYTGDLLSPNEKLKLTKNINGYDISPDMVKLALVNLYLHGFKEPQIFEYDTLSDEKRWDEDYDVILANPPFMTPKGGISPHKRFSVQARRSEVLFVDYIAEHLKIGGRAGIIVPEGIIFQASNAYKSLRKNLIENWGLWAVISLPNGVFQPYAGVKTSILILDKALAKHYDEILFIKIENDGFDLGAQRRKIDKNDLPIALEFLKQWKESKTINEKTKISMILPVKKSKIAENGDYNLTGDRYRKSIDYSKVKWDMVELGEVLEYEQPTNYLVESIDYKDDYEIPVLTAGKSFLLGYTNEENGIFSKEKLPVIIFDDFTTSTQFVDFPFKVKSSAMKILKATDNIDIRFAYYVIKLIDFDATQHKRYWISQFSKKKIPLPPLNYQKQIVAEIEQYQKVIDGAKQVVEHWKPSFRIDPDWERVELGDVCKIFGGGTPSRSRKEFWNGDIPWITARYFTDDHTINGFENITAKGLKNSSSKIAPEGSTILITRVSVGKFAYADQDYAINQDLTSLVPDTNKINNKYLLLISSLVAREIEKNAVGMGVKGVTREFVVKQKIPLPPPEVQEQIVAEIEDEQKAIDECKKLIEKMEKKIEQKISEVWGEI